MKIWTVGHSTRTSQEFVDLLHSAGIRQLVDVRSVPRSRHTPQFNTEQLAADLPAAGIGYRRAPGLGGWRKPRPDSVNTGWRNASFRGYADYMQTPEFSAALDELVRWAEQPTAIMCAEAVPWRCHRSLIADALTARGIEVRHIIGPSDPDVHLLTKFAQVSGQIVSYPKDTSGQESLGF